MPELHEVSYSREATVAAVREYYCFLTRMYLKECYVAEPPEWGWPEINPETLGVLGKTDEVISLLRHLLYIQSSDDSALGAAVCLFADWRDVARSASLGQLSVGDVGVTTEHELPKPMYPHVVGLTHGGYYNPAFLLDTKLGIVYWHECHSDIKRNPSREPIGGEEYDGYDDISWDEADWRSDSVAWSISDFFELLKDLFRRLFYVPISPRKVCFASAMKGMPMLAAIYRAHCWPDLERYHKQDCLKAVQDLMEERYPDDADRREKDE
ncbi:hypothetical protein C8A01DRAFT_31149 [Parachaetomium inaequale]|uniref:Uncharacterized protein n=1 Tax=Parachaetomium inaequale TaxID=2588326 RepID=A0AAN6PRI7_9PEZI|nr:hypothetical protein C8A01DRAFT_31149 [Parachaetomium inaequale]